MGVCCIVFDSDGMLFEFFMNFLNIEKNEILRIVFSKFHVFFTFHAISNIKKKIIWCKRIAVFSRNFAGTCTKSWGCAV